MPQKGIIRITKTGEVFWTVTEADGIYKPVYAVKSLPGAVFEVRAAEDMSKPFAACYSGAACTRYVSHGFYPGLCAY